MPVHNGGKYISQSITSVKLQIFQDWELIVVDDCSKDYSVSLVKEFCEADARIRLIQLEQNSGAAVARNFGINFSKGRYLTFLDCDDYWGSKFLSASLNCIEGKGFIYSSYFLVDSHGLCLDSYIVGGAVGSRDLLRGTPISCLTAFIDTQSLGKKLFPVGPFREDLAYWCALLGSDKKAYGYEFCEASYRVHDGSSSSHKLKMAMQTWKDYKNHYKLPFFERCVFFGHYTVAGIRKYLRRSKRGISSR